MQMMQFQQQEMGGNEYSRVLLVRPDLLMVKSLHLNALPPGKIYCNSFGNAAGDFRFVMESKHVPNLVAALSPHESPSKWFVLGGHGNMRQFTLNVLRVPITGDAQLFAGEDEDVYRKIDWGAMQCSAPNWWRDFMKAEYGMKEDDWLAIYAFSKYAATQKHTNGVHILWATAVSTIHAVRCPSICSLLVERLWIDEDSVRTRKRGCRN